MPQLGVDEKNILKTQFIMENLMNISEIKVEFEPEFKVSKRPKINSSSDAYKVLMQVWDKGLMGFLEEFKVILLNNSNRVLGIIDLARGGKDFVLVDIRIIFSIALKAAATKIILAHNHPSGELKPSTHDKEITDKIMQSGELLNIKVCDHLIITSDSYISMKEEGFM